LEEALMLRTLATIALIGAFTLATTPGFACTAFALKAKDGAAIYGRTMEFGYPTDSNVVVIPAGTAMSGTLPDGGKGITYNTKYAMLGANAVGVNVIIDGMNDQGLAIGLLYFPEFAEYANVTPENASRAMAPHEFGNWVLGNFATVDEVKAGLKGAVIVPTPAPVLNAPQPLHFIVVDRSGKALVIEPVGGELKAYDNPLGVMTNAPGFEWHLLNLRNYVNLTVTGVPPVDLGSTKLTQLGQGAGMHGLPGDFTPPSRFVRAVAFSQAQQPSATAQEAVLSAFHILNQFDIPYGVVHGTIGSASALERTQWTTVADTKNLRWYFKTYGDQSIHMIDLNKALDDARGQVRTIRMGTDQPIIDLSTQYMGAE
jgi:choloylglycine hydrolase